MDPSSSSLRATGLAQPASTEMATPAEDVPHHRASLSSSQSSLNLIMLSWLHPVSVTSDHLISSIEKAPTTRIAGLKWCKDRKGVKHQFLLVEVERPETNNLWIRLDRRLQRDPTVKDWVAAIHPSSPTTAELCDDPQLLVHPARSKLVVETEFSNRPPLEELRNLLLILESSPRSKTYPEDVIFCSVIYDSLCEGTDIAGPPSEANISIVSSARAKIKKLVDARRSIYNDSTLSDGSADEGDTTDDEMLQEEESGETMEDRRNDDEQRILTLQTEELRQLSKKIPHDLSSRDVDLASSSSSSSLQSDSSSTSEDKSSAAESTLFDENEKRKLRLRSSVPSSRRGVISVSVKSEHTSPFAHQWQHPITITIPSLLSYAGSASIHVTFLRWCKDRKGVPHEFLLLEIEKSKNRTSWLRLDRRANQNATRMEVLSSTSASADTAMLCANLASLYDATQSEIQVETEFTDPPALGMLGNLLSVITTVSPHYKLYPENCAFFCSVIYDHLFSMGGGKDVHGIRGKFAMSLAPKTRAKIAARLRPLFSTTSQEGFPSERPDNASEDGGQLQVPNAVTETKFAAQQFRVAVLATSFWQRLRTRAHNRRVEALSPIDGSHEGGQQLQVTNAVAEIEFSPDRFRVAVLATRFWQRLKARAHNRRDNALSPSEEWNVVGTPTYATSTVNLSNDTIGSRRSAEINAPSTTAGSYPDLSTVQDIYRLWYVHILATLARTLQNDFVCCCPGKDDTNDFMKRWFAFS